jgi:uncharacterized membrane protein YphA (DoxX/SURF4 family)
MTDLIRLGRWFYAVAIAGFGVQFLVHAWFRGPVPGPPWVPGRPFLAYSTAIVLIAAAVCIMAGKKVRWAAMLLAIMLLLRAVLIYAPRIAANPHDPGPWTSGFEILAMCGASLVIAGSLVGVGRYFLPACWSWSAFNIFCMPASLRRWFLHGFPVICSGHIL